jgi:DNA-binding MarR family transcriptional regulator
MMSNMSAGPDAMTALILETFRLNGRLLAAGDALVAPLGLTSARWQVLGAVALAAQPGPIAHVARAMGLTRQNVRRIVGDLAAAGLLELAPNPNHRRAPLVRLTAAGRRLYAETERRQRPWATALAEGLTAEELAGATRLLRRLRARLAEAAEELEGAEDG